jgi:hypothetical protein
MINIIADMCPGCKILFTTAWSGANHRYCMHKRCMRSSCGLVRTTATVCTVFVCSTDSSVNHRLVRCAQPPCMRSPCMQHRVNPVDPHLVGCDPDVMHAQPMYAARVTA